ncbi:hypothetical protein BTVI_158782 [Pitangus sulphuratus]|nr:hypothetical protein BTVI_158782 [Pitangus sulphuratus]
MSPTEVLEKADMGPHQECIPLQKHRQEFKEEVERLRSIKESEREIDWWSRSHTLSTPKEVQKESEKPCPSCHQADGKDQVDGGEGKQESGQRSKRIPSQPPSPSKVPLKNRYEGLDPESQANDTQEKDLSGGSPGCTLSIRWITTTVIKKKRRVVVVSDSFLRGTEGPVGQPDPPHREVYCLPGARVGDITRRFPKLILPSDYYPLTVDSDELNKRGTRPIKKDFKALDQLVNGTGAQVVFASIPAAAGMNEE